MPSTSPARPSPNATPANSTPGGLDDLRAEIDRIDDAMHDLLMRRAAVVEQVGELRKVSYRPGREARIIRRLLARHAGPLPRRALGRLWREVFASHIAIETAFAIAVCDADASGEFAAVAREHFGALTPLHVHSTPAQALAEIGAATVTAAVLPMPLEDEPARAAWWLALLRGDEPRLHVVARLPFWASPRSEGSASAQALVVAASPPDPSGHDRSLLGFELPPETSRARLTAGLTASGLQPGTILARRDAAGGGGHGLVDLDGHMTDDDPRLRSLAGIVQRPMVLGGYAVPVAADGT